MTDESMQEAIESVTGQIRREVFAAFMPLNEIVPAALETVDDECDTETLRPIASRIFDEVLAEYRSQMAVWPGVTDCDRFDAACEDLEEAGIVCRQNYLCCGTCGCGAIMQEMEAQRDRGREVVGYLFYHEQDTDGALDGEGVYLNYGSVLRGDDAAVSIGHQIVAAMRARGLRVVWNGSIEQRIHVALDWKRRRGDC